MHCDACQGEVDTHDKFCRHCGVAVGDLAGADTLDSSLEKSGGVSVEAVAKDIKELLHQTYAGTDTLDFTLEKSGGVSVEAVVEDIKEFLHQTYGHDVEQSSVKDEEVTSETETGEQSANPTIDASINIPVESELFRFAQETYGYETRPGPAADNSVANAVSAGGAASPLVLQDDNEPAAVAKKRASFAQENRPQVRKGLDSRLRIGRPMGSKLGTECVGRTGLASVNGGLPFRLSKIR